MSSPTLEVLDYGMLSQNISSILLDPPMNSTDTDDEYKLFDNYFPLLLMLISLPRNETESLEKYMNQRTYAELKRMIDEKQKDSDITELITELEQNNTDLAEFVSVVDNQKYVNLVEAYHNASIYNAIRGVWSSQLNPLLPAIDQLAILEYFAERRSNEHFRMSFWARLWAAIRAWLSGKQEFIGSSILPFQKILHPKTRKAFSECNADEPRCMRRIVEKLPLEARVELDRAAETEDLATVENIITEEQKKRRGMRNAGLFSLPMKFQLTNQPKSARVEYELWKNANQPPQPLLDIIADKTDVEERALERLRAFDLVNSLKDYYRAMIESRSQAEQEVSPSLC
ncbi:hypothetical protein ANCDUO_11637 [Ancylostoma duodenale]|uniref:Uncharacterized protein n=1 Tax=Ancylostoma duodenale TaxID=51022 RepID=A0A0C2CN76_9BILA|nr:hypothetical protein ANCDUO_11637 [Ancylostoma duodenale]